MLYLRARTGGRCKNKSSILTLLCLLASELSFWFPLHKALQGRDLLLQETAELNSPRLLQPCGGFRIFISLSISFVLRVSKMKIMIFNYRFAQRWSLNHKKESNSTLDFQHNHMYFIPSFKVSAIWKRDFLRSLCMQIAKGNIDLGNCLHSMKII